MNVSRPKDIFQKIRCGLDSLGSGQDRCLDNVHRFP